MFLPSKKLFLDAQQAWVKTENTAGYNRREDCHVASLGFSS